MNNFRFIIHNNSNQPEGEFIWDDSYSGIFNSYFDALELYEDFEEERAVKKFRYILRKDPSFIPAINAIGWYFYENQKYSKALEYYSRAYEICRKEIPQDFNGKVQWGFLNNRDFLRTLQGIGLANTALGNFYAAIQHYEKILVYNPTDNQGIRYMIGDLYFIVGDLDTAETYYKDNLDVPSLRYSYGLLLLRKQRVLESIVQFSLGIIMDEYLCRILIHKKIPDKWNNITKIENAVAYYTSNFILWYEDDGEKLLKNIYRSDTFKTWYELIVNIREKLKNCEGTSEEDMEHRRILMHEESEIISTVDREYALILFNEINKVHS